MASCLLDQHDRSMSSNFHRRAETPTAAAVGALVPWAAFLIALAVVDAGRDHGSGSLAGLAAVAPVYLGFVALPSLFPLLAARAGARRLAVLVVMTAVAATSAVSMATSDDAQAGLAVLLVPYVAIPLAVVVWAGEAVAARRMPPLHAEPLAAATASDRLAALAIDVAILGASLLFPLTAMSRAKQEVAAGLVGVAVGTAYMGALVAVRRRTVGHSLLRLAVVDATTLERVGALRATLRSLIIVVEVAAAATITFALPAVAELVSVAASGRSLTDRLLRTSVVTD
jgi:RDD family